MSTTSGRLIAGATGSGKGLVLWSRPQAAMDAGERLILLRVDRAVRVGERELRYQLEHKDQHPLAHADELLDVLVQLEAEGLVDSELTFRLTAQGRAQLAGPDADGSAER